MKSFHSLRSFYDWMDVNALCITTTAICPQSVGAQSGGERTYRSKSPDKCYRFKPSLQLSPEDGSTIAIEINLEINLRCQPLESLASLPTPRPRRNLMEVVNQEEAGYQKISKLIELNVSTEIAVGRQAGWGKGMEGGVGRWEV